MSIPYPKRSVSDPVFVRPSINSGRSGPVFPANDRYFGGFGSPKARPLPSGAFVPSRFQGPAISYGQPLRKPPPVWHIPDNATKTTYLRLGSNAAQKAAKAMAYYQAFDAVDGIVTAYLSPPAGERVPIGGMFERKVGPFSYSPAAWDMPNPGAAFSVYLSGAITNQAISSWLGKGNFAVPAGWNQAGIWVMDRGNPQRFAQISGWTRTTIPAKAHNVASFNKPWAMPLNLSPYSDPMAIPIGSPYFARPMPYRLIPDVVQNPFRSPIEQSISGNSQPRTRGAPAPRAGSRPFGRKGGNVPIERVTQITVSGTGSSTTKSFERSGKQSKPKKNVKERKAIRTLKGGSPLGLAVGVATEGVDAVNDIWKSLPKANKTGYYKLHYRDKVTGEIKEYYKYRHRASLSDKIADIDRGFVHLDLNKALNNLVDNGIQDTALGVWGRAAAKARNMAYDPATGVDYGPHGRGYQTGSGLSDNVYNPQNGF
jgi:hypothetical protein